MHISCLSRWLAARPVRVGYWGGEFLCVLIAFCAHMHYTLYRHIWQAGLCASTGVASGSDRRSPTVAAATWAAKSICSSPLRSSRKFLLILPPRAPLLKDKGISRLPESVYLLLLLLWSTVAVAVVCCCCCGGYIAVT